MSNAQLVFLATLLLVAHGAAAQETDSMIDVGGHRLHFHIVKGVGTPILFEAGGGDDATSWSNLLQPLSDITGAPLITYDRSGFGKSELDGRNDDIARHGIENGVADLEAALKQLGYAGGVVLVAHSYGGFYATLYAARHPSAVKSAVLLDANTACFFTDEFLAQAAREREPQLPKLKRERPGLYYLSANIPATIALLRKTPFPTTIPLIDIVAERPPFRDAAEVTRWKRCHQTFVDGIANRKGIEALGSAHFVHRENPLLVIGAITQAYVKIAPPTQRAKILQRALDYSLIGANQARQREVAWRHSEAEINVWGYDLLGRGEKDKALEVFKLNTVLYPQQANVYDSLAEAYENTGNKELAIKNYQRVLQLDPHNHNAEQHLQKLNGAP